jgi:hypothetical protein
MVAGDNKFTIKHICSVLNNFIFLTVTSISTVNTNVLFRFHYKNSYANASQYFIIRMLPSFADFLTFVPVMPTTQSQLKKENSLRVTYNGKAKNLLFLKMD